MGLFDFARNIGKKIGLTDNEPDPKDAKAVQLANQRRSIALTGEIKKLGLDIKNLKIAFAAGKATIDGQAGSPQNVHKAVVALGNIEGVNQVNSRLTVPAPPRAAASAQAAPAAVEPPPPILYTVKAGDSLSLIAKALYGPIHLYPAIFEANQPTSRRVVEDAAPDDSHDGAALWGGTG